MYLHFLLAALRAPARPPRGSILFIAAIALLALPSLSSAQEEIHAGCDATITWEVGGADTVATVDVLLIGSAGDTLATLATAAENSGEASVTVPCFEAGTVQATLRVVANDDPPFFLRDESVNVVSQAPSVSVLADDAVADSTCTAAVNFAATIEDDCGVDADSVAVSAVVVSGAAEIGAAEFTSGGDGDSLSVSGTVAVSALEGSPVMVAIMVTGFDNCGLATMAVDTVAVIDDIPPVITCPDSVAVECTGAGGTPADDPALADFFADATATDNCEGEVEVTNDAPEFFPLGTTVVTFTAADASGNTSQCSAPVTVADTEPPTLTVELNRTYLWPPNHKFFDIVAHVTVDDVCDTAATFVLLSVESDEPANGRGDGNTSPDIQGVDEGADTTFALRAERSGNGDGRTYTIVYLASDQSGNTAGDTTTVFVPHDQGGHAESANGFDDDGGDIDAGSDQILLVVASAPGLDATGIDARRAQIGNVKGALYPEAAYRGDVNHDGSDDLVLAYSARDAQNLRAMIKGNSDKTSLHYVDGATHYVVGDIFNLGRPMSVDVSTLEPIPFTAEATADDAGGTPSASGGRTLDQIRLSAYPNPFNPQTVVTYELDVAGPTTVRIYDARGRYIQTLVNGTESAGIHSVVWGGVDHRGQGVASGIYFLRLQTQGRAVTRKIVLLK